MPNTVRVFQSTDTGAPVLSGTAGTLITLLDACLKDGYGSVTLDSIVIANNVATCTKSAGHGFTGLGTVYPVIRISGATPSALNADWRITIVSSTVFTFATSGITDQTATGTIAAKRAPLGFEKAFSGTNKAAYRSQNVLGTRLYLRVDDSPAQYPTLIMYEAMSDIDTGTGLSPTSGNYYTCKSTSANSTARAWRLIGDDRAFYLFTSSDSSTWTSGLFFGDLVSYKSGDAYHCGLIANSAAGADFYLYSVNGSTSASWLARSYSQTGGAIAASRYSHRKVDSLGYGGMAYPCPTDNSLHIHPVECWESTTTPRGLLPGLYCPLHSSAPADGTVINQVLSLAGGAVLVQQTGGANYRAALAIDTAWR